MTERHPWQWSSMMKLELDSFRELWNYMEFWSAPHSIEVKSCASLKGFGFPSASSTTGPAFTRHQALAVPRSSYCAMAMKHKTYRQVCAFGIRSPNVQGPLEQDLAHTWSLDSQWGGGKGGTQNRLSLYPQAPGMHRAQNGGGNAPRNPGHFCSNPPRWRGQPHTTVFKEYFLGSTWGGLAGHGIERELEMEQKTKRKRGKKRKLNSCCIIFI